MEEIDIDIEFQLDEIDLGIETVEIEVPELPSTYLYLEGLVMMNQIKGLVHEDFEDLLTLPLYAEKNGEPKSIGVVEITAENILTMQLLGLKVTIQRDNKEPTDFTNVEDYVSIIKTLRGVDRCDTGDINVHSSDAQHQ